MTASTDDIARVAWARRILGLINRLPTARNISSLIAWSFAEGGGFGNIAKFNPLNTTQPAIGSVSINSVGVKAYISSFQGDQATAQTLKNGYYKHIMDGFASSVTPTAMSALVGSSPWGTNGALMLQCVPRACAVVSRACPPAKVTAKVVAVVKHPILAAKYVAGKAPGA